VHASAAPLSVIRVDLPFVQSVVALSGYAVEVAAATGVDIGRAGRCANARIYVDAESLGWLFIRLLLTCRSECQTTSSRTPAVFSHWISNSRSPG